MRTYLATAPAWFWAAFQGVLYAACMSVSSVFSDHTSWRKALIEGVVIAPLWALIVWFTSRRERQATSAILGSMTLEQRRAVLNAAGTGAPPDDPALRPAAVAMVRERLVEHDRHRTFPIVVFACFLGLSVLLAVTDGLEYLAGTALFGSALVWAVRYPGQLHRRLASLEAAARPPPPPGKSRLH